MSFVVFLCPGLVPSRALHFHTCTAILSSLSSSTQSRTCTTASLSAVGVVVVKGGWR